MTRMVRVVVLCILAIAASSIVALGMAVLSNRLFDVSMPTGFLYGIVPGLCVAALVVCVRHTARQTRRTYDKEIRKTYRYVEEGAEMKQKIDEYPNVCPLCPHCAGKLKTIATALYSHKKAKGVLKYLGMLSRGKAGEGATPVFVCPHCWKLLGVGGGAASYIGEINIDT
jgi:hypothetical protein